MAYYTGFVVQQMRVQILQAAPKKKLLDKDLEISIINKMDHSRSGYRI